MAEIETLYFNNVNFPNAHSGPGFVALSHFPHKRGIAFEYNEAFFAAGINNGGEVFGISKLHCDAKNCREWVLKSFGDGNPESKECEPGVYYKRMRRWNSSLLNGGYPVNLYKKERDDTCVALRILFKKLEEIFETVEPNDSNKKCYGHKIREVLLLACMEVESGWTAVLKENNYTKKSTFNTNDYIKLKSAMGLDIYTVALKSNPGFATFNPFEGWNETKPTESLPWYNAYNNVKHDREKNLHFATLEMAVQACAAALVMFNAQFRYVEVHQGDARYHFMHSIFQLMTTNTAEYEKDSYISKWTMERGISMPSPVHEWIAKDYPFNNK